MTKVFGVTPKLVERTNGTVLTPDMTITVTTLQHTSDPPYDGAKEACMRLCRFDYQKGCCRKWDFEVGRLG